MDEQLKVISALGIGAVVAALIAGFIARGVAIAQLRQAWINALREDLANFVSAVDFVSAMSEVTPERQAELGFTPADIARRMLESSQAEYRVVLRLNVAEADHVRLQSLVSQVPIHVNGGRVQTAAHLDQIVYLSQAILKREWEVTKSAGLLAEFRLRKKSRPDPHAARRGL